MGCVGPKSAIEVRDGMTFLDLSVRQIEVQRLWLAAPQTNINRLFSYQAYRIVPIEIKPTATAHYMSFRQDEEMIVCSRQVNNVHGIAKISMRDFSNNLHEIIPTHSQAIRDVQCYSGDPAVNKSLVLTASMDKTLKVTSVASQHVVLSYDLMAPVWSCCWSMTDPFAIYCSVKANQTSILTFDLRNTKTPVASFSRPALLGHSPIHSMAHIGPSQIQKREGILCGNLEGAFIYNFESHDSYGVLSQESVTSGSQGHDSVSDHERRIPLRFQESSCSSVSFDSVSRQWMASFKFLGKPFTRHVRGKLEQDESNGSLLLKSEINVAGGPPVWVMSRTSVFSRNDGSVHMAAGSEGMAHIWHESSRANSSRSQESTLEATPHGEFSPSLKEDESLERLVIGSSGYEASYGPCPVKDIKAVSVGQHEYVAMLSDRQLELFRWSETRPGGFYASDDDSVGSEDNGERERKGKKRARHEIAAGATVITLDDD
ncbi:RING finger and WD repeat domain-containing protein 3 [Mortierella polycephala]|uniref:RING-type E3 ubiquitin transferase n=1 Tax=Mortierella polycephala TaxID=41804 RepID=A0A9P6PK24_9FUNG|nr:RING finger and WD repeat domain-containing protein 3 [Mortierella polycephala]